MVEFYNSKERKLEEIEYDEQKENGFIFDIDMDYVDVLESVGGDVRALRVKMKHDDDIDDQEYDSSDTEIDGGISWDIA